MSTPKFKVKDSGEIELASRPKRGLVRSLRSRRTTARAQTPGDLEYSVLVAS